MESFRRVFAYILRYRARLTACLISVLLIGVLYSVGIGAVLPVLKIMIGDEGLHGWVRRVRVEARLRVDFRYDAEDTPGFRVLRVNSGAGIPELVPSDNTPVFIVAVGASDVGVTKVEREVSLHRLLDHPVGEPLALTIRRGAVKSQLLITPGPEPAWSAWAGRAIDALPDDGPGSPMERRLQVLVIVMLVLLAINFLSGVARFLQEYLVEWISSRVLMDMRCEAFDSVVHGSLADIGKVGTNDILGRFGREYEDIRDGIVQVLGRVLREPIKAVAVVAVAFYLDWRLTLICMVGVPIVAGLIRQFGKKMHRAAKKSLEATGAMLGLVQQTLLGLRVVKAYTMEGAERKRFRDENRRYVRHTMKFATFQAIAEPLMEFLGGLGAGVIAVGAAWLVFTAQMEREDFFAFLVCMAAIADPARKLTSVFGKVRKADAASQRVFDLIDRRSEDDETVDPPGRAVAPLVSELRFEHVNFSYRPDALVLDDVDLSIPAGKTIAIVGPNGSGKTTLVSLAARFFKPDTGRVLWDGLDLATAHPGALRRRIGLVTQDAIIFKDTVANNISYGEVECPRDRVIDAAKKARAHDFIEAITDSQGRRGYDAVLTEHGQSLSGGQRQRIALARAILRDPSLLILDEATSQIDSESEGLIREALDEFTRNRTTLVIAHRLSTIQKADRILLMDAGRAAAMGTHADLLRTSPLYKRLCDRQFLDNPDSSGNVPVLANETVESASASGSA